MRAPWGNPEAVAREIDCHLRQEKVSADKVVRPLFGPVVKAIWPHKTAMFLADFAGASERTAARWVSGEIDPPAFVYAKLWLKIIESRTPTG